MEEGEALSKAPVSPATGTEKTGHTSSLCRRKCPGYVRIIRSGVLANSQKKKKNQPTEGCSFSESLLMCGSVMLLTVWCSLYTQTCTHACSSPRQPHPLRRGGERCNSSPLPCWLLRQSDWPRLLKMDLEHLPFIAFPLPLPDVTAEHDFPRKKKKKVLLPFPTLRTIGRRRSCCPFFYGPRRSSSITVGFFYCWVFLHFCPRCKMRNDIRNAVACGQCCDDKALCNEALPVQL